MRDGRSVQIHRKECGIIDTCSRKMESKLLTLIRRTEEREEVVQIFILKARKIFHNL